jgi:predicted Zn finger-like uncharacterized protein
MDIRCGNCSKLFRVADEKISGKGIRFKCTKCGDLITVTRQDLEMDLLAREGGPEVAAVKEEPAAAVAASQPAARQAPPPAMPEERAAPAPEGPPGEFEAQEYKPPRAGIEDFDFSAPYDAAQHAQQADAGQGGPSLDEQPEQEQEPQAAGEISISADEEKEAEAAFTFPTDLISEPERTPAFAAEQEQEPGAGPEASATAPDTGAAAAPEPSIVQEQVPELTLEPEQQPELRKGPEKTTQPPVTGPVFTPPAKSRPASPARSEEDIDLAAALAIPRTPDREERAWAPRTGAGMQPAESGEAGGMPLHHPIESDIHPLASGTITGAAAGLGCAVPLVAILLAGLGLVMKFVPFLADMPFYHLLLVIGTGIFGMGVMIALLIAFIQAGAGKKLFFLLNMLIGAVFGACFGAVMYAAVALASGKEITVNALLSDAAGWGMFAFLLSIAVVIMRRILVFTRNETFSASMSGIQKAGFILSVAVVLVSLYAEATLIGRIDQSGRTMVSPVREEITPDGLSVMNARAYIEPSTGDLVVTGTVKNDLDRSKPGWLLQADVYDADRKVVATLTVVNGVQVLTQQDYATLEKRGVSREAHKARMALSVHSAVIPAKGSVQFEARLMNPPAGIASFLPVLKAFDPAAAFKSIMDDGDRRAP